jgi:hypothetical protein
MIRVAEKRLQAGAEFAVAGVTRKIRSFRRDNESSSGIQGIIHKDPSGTRSVEYGSARGMKLEWLEKLSCLT